MRKKEQVNFGSSAAFVVATARVACARSKWTTRLKAGSDLVSSGKAAIVLATQTPNVTK